MTVLIVDGECRIQEMLALCLSEAGHQVVSVSSGQATLDYLRENPAPRVIVLDIHLPDMRGEELLRRFHECPSMKDIPLVVTSDHFGENEFRLVAMSRVALCPKPFTIEAMLRIVAEQCKDKLPAGLRLPPRSKDPTGGRGASRRSWVN